MPLPRVTNVAHGPARARLSGAIRDLKRIAVWDDLTADLQAVRLSSQPGEANVPLDRHLADALLTGVVDRRGTGVMCDVMFYPAAVAEDLERIDAYHSAGRLPDPAPPRRAFWAALLAHELAHCLGPTGRGEDVARRWEARVLALLESE